jgi:hypothetical protein
MARLKTQEDIDALTHRPEDAPLGPSAFESTPWAMFKKDAPRLAEESVQDFGEGVVSGIPFGAGTGLVTLASEAIGPESHQQVLARQKALERQAEERSPFLNFLGSALPAAGAFKLAGLAGDVASAGMSSAGKIAPFLKSAVRNAPSSALAGLDTFFRTESPEAAALAAATPYALPPVKKATEAAASWLTKTNPESFIRQALGKTVSATPEIATSALSMPDPSAGAAAWLDWAMSLGVVDNENTRRAFLASPTRSVEQESARKAALRKLRGVEKIPVERPPTVEQLPEGQVRRRQEDARTKFFSSQTYTQKANQQNSPETQKLMERSPIAVQFPLKKDVLDSFMGGGQLRNLFETGTGKGSTDQNLRRTAESNVLNISGSEPGHARPIYGALHVNQARNATGWQQGAAPSYGDAWLELKPEVKQRSTYTNGDSFFADSVIPGEFVSSFGDTGKLENSYIEAQIHGGVHLNRDVQAIHVPESAVQNNPGEFSQLRQVAKRYKVPVVVHGQDRLGNDKAFAFTPDMR